MTPQLDRHSATEAGNPNAVSACLFTRNFPSVVLAGVIVAGRTPCVSKRCRLVDCRKRGVAAARRKCPARCAGVGMGRIAAVGDGTRGVGKSD